MPSLPHTFRDPSLLALALTHSSVHEARDNERLEFLGDAALDLIVAEVLVRRRSIEATTAAALTGAPEANLAPRSRAKV